MKNTYLIDPTIEPGDTEDVGREYDKKTGELLRSVHLRRVTVNGYPLTHVKDTAHGVGPWKGKDVSRLSAFPGHYHLDSDPLTGWVTPYPSHDYARN